MDFQCMKRKQLQALCKKHGVSANLSNLEMADRLSLIFKKSKRGSSSVEKSSKKVSGSNSKVASKIVKKVRFSPEHETIIYEVSGYKRGGRRSTRKTLPEKRIQATEKEILSVSSTGSKRARRDVKNDNVEAKSDFQKRNVSQRGSKKAKNEVSEDNDVDVKGAKFGGRITRSRASENGAVQEECGNVPQFDEIHNGKGRIATQKIRAGSEIPAGDGAKEDKVSRKTRENATRNGDSEMLIENSSKVEVLRRNTRSQAKMAGKALEEEASMDQGRNASRRDSIAPKKRRVGRRTLAVEANATKDGDSEKSTEEETVQHEEPSKVLGRYASRQKSIVPQKGKAESDGFQEKKETRKRLRNTARNLEAAVGKPSMETEKVEKVSVPSGHSRRTRRSTVVFSSSVSTLGELETHQTVEETRKRTRNSNTKLETASRFEAIEESSKETEKVVNVSVPSGSSRRSKRNYIMVTSSVSTDREVESHQTVRVEDACLSKGHQRRSSQNASKSNSMPTNSKLEGIAGGVGKGKQQKQRQEQIIDEDISASKCKTLAENPPRRSSRLTSKGDLVKPAGPKDRIVGKKRHCRSKLPVIGESPSESFSAPEEPLIEDVRLAVGEAERTKNNLNARYSQQVLRSSNNKKKTYRGQLAAMEQRDSVEVSTANPEIKEDTNTTENLEETSPANQLNKLNRKGDFGDVSLAELEVTEMNNKVSNVISPEITSPTVESSPANQSDNLTEASDGLAWEKAIETEEPSTAKDHGSGDADDHLNKDYITSVQSEDAKETAETVIQEAIVEVNLNELSERSKEKRFEIPLEKAEELSIINPSDEQGRSHTKKFLEAVELQEIAAESNLVTGESSAPRTVEGQSSANGGNATEATPSTPALETEGFDNKVNNDPDHFLIVNNVDMKEGAYNAEAQNVLQSTELERGNTNYIGEEEFSCNGMVVSDKIIYIGESSVSNAWNGISGQEKTTDDVTTNNIQPEEMFYNERTSQVLGEKITEDYNENLLVGDSAITGSDKRNDGDTDEVVDLSAQDAVDIENEVSEQNPNNFSQENRGRCMHEPLDAEEIDLIITEERGTDVVNDTSVASIDLQSPFTGDKGICPELAFMENEIINDECDTVADFGTKKSFSSGARLSVHNDMQDKLKAKLNEDVMDVLMAEVQTEPLSQFALEKLQNSMENDTHDASNSSGKILCQPIGDCNSGSNAEEQDSDLVGEECNSVATREIDGKGFNGEADVKLCTDVAEKNPECALKVELDKNVHNLETKDIDGKESDVEEYADVVKEENADCVLEVEFGDKKDLEGMAQNINDSAGATLREIIVNESEFSDDIVKIMTAPSEYLDRVDMLKMEESNMKNRNSDAVVIDVGVPSQVIVNHNVEMEGADVDDSSIQSSQIATDKETGTETIRGKAFGDKFTEINDATPGAFNEIISAPCEDLEKKSVEVLGPLQHVNEVKFDSLKDSKEENVLELERICFVTSDGNDTDTFRKANVEKMAGDLNFNLNGPNLKEDSINTIPQVSTNDIDDHWLEVEFHNADSDQNVMLDDAGEVSVVGDIDFENVEDGTKGVQKTPNFSETIENRREWSMKNSANKCFADSSIDKLEMDSNAAAAVSHSMVRPSLENKFLELHVDLPQLTSPEANTLLMVEQVEVEKSAGGNLEGNLVTRDLKEALEVKERPTNVEQVIQQVTEKQLGVQEHQIHFTVSDEPLEVTRDLDDVLEAKESVTTNEQVNQQVTEKRFDEQESQSHLSVSDELLEMTPDCDGSLEVKENVTTDEQVPKLQLGEQESRSHLTVSDEPILDDEETNKQNGPSAINRECNGDDIHKNSSNVSAEKVMLKDATQTSGSNVDDSDMFKVEHGSHDSRKADTVAVDSAVYNFSGSKRVAANEEVNREGAKKMDMLEEVENGGTWIPIRPVELCIDHEEPEEASPGISGTVLQQIFLSSSGWEEKKFSENRLFADAFSESEFTASSSSYLYDLTFCNEIQIKDTSNDAGDEMVDDEDRGKSNATESFSVQYNRTDTQEVIKEQLGEDEGNRNDATCPDIIFCKALNQLSRNNKSKSHVVEADGLHCTDDEVVTAGNSKEIVDFDSSTSASSLVPEMVVDCPTVSPPFDFSNSDAGASETCLISQDAWKEKENAVTVEQVAPQITEVQLSEHETTEEVAKFKSTLLSDFVEPTCEGGQGSKEQGLLLDMKHGSPDHKNPKIESLKLKRIDSAPVRDAAAGDPWRLELDLLSPPKKSPDVKSVKDLRFAKKMNSSMKMNLSLRKQSNRSSLIQRTPKQLVHDMKENVLSTKREFSSITAHKTGSKRRALEDLQKN